MLIVSAVSIRTGLSAAIDLTVSDADTAIAMRSGEVPVLATPRILALVEEATVRALDGHLDEGSSTVGMRVQLEHISPTAIGGVVRAEANLEKVEGRRLLFHVSARDERGLVVWAEIPLNAKVSGSDPVTNAASQLTELIVQQRHHPSIVCWGVQNETLISESSADPRPVIAELHALARELDPSRRTAQAQVFMAGPEDPINALCDLNARNLYAGWYYGRAEQAGDDLDRHHAANPGVPLGLSEYGADARTEYHATDPEPGDYTEDYQAAMHEVYWRLIDERP